MFSETQRNNSSYLYYHITLFLGQKEPSYLFKINYAMLELEGFLELVVMAQACSPSTWEAEARGSL